MIKAIAVLAAAVLQVVWAALLTIFCVVWLFFLASLFGLGDVAKSVMSCVAWCVALGVPGYFWLRKHYRAGKED